MAMLTRLSPLLRRPLAISAVTTLLLVLASLGLFAKQETSPVVAPSALQTATSSSETDAAGLLPVIPSSMPQFHPVIPGEMPPQHRVTFGVLPDGPPDSNPDEDKQLYGYSGPYYNTTDLDGRVVVLNQSLYTWPTLTWKSSGLLRNQTSTNVHITRIRASLFGPHGELLAMASATAPVADLRPGEPGPFVIEAPVAASAVSSVDWRIDYYTSQEILRQFTFSVFSTQASVRYGYYLFGRIANAAATSSPTRIVAAWLNYDGYGRVLYVDSPKIAFVTTTPELAGYRDTISLPAGVFDDFVYRNKDPNLVSTLYKAKLALWGTSK